MNMKQKLALLLAGLMVFSLAACTGGASGENAASTAAPAPDTAAGSEAAGEAGSAAVAEVEALTILASTTYNENETGGKIVQHFIDQLDSLSGGAVTVNMNWGGTLFDAAGEFDAVADGAVNLVFLGHMPHTGTLNYLGFPGFAPGGTQKALDYFNELLFDNPETSVLVQEEAAEYNIKYLNVIAGGANALCASYEFSDLDTLVSGSKSFGNFSAAMWEALGFQVTPVTPPEVYDALNRGLIDSTQMALAPMVSMAWYEVAPWWAIDGTYTAGNMCTVTLDWWETLSAAQQEVIQQAADATEEYSRGIYDEAIASDIAAVEAGTGNAFVELSDEDVARLWAACFDATAEAALTNAAKGGKEEGMTKILEVAAEFTGHDWQH